MEEKNYKRGSEWRKWDLQVQPIKDEWFSNLSSNIEKIKRATKEYMNSAKKSGISVIAITDHNCGIAIDKALQIIEEDNISDLVVLPGIEIDTQEGFQLLIIFSEVYKEKIKKETWEEVIENFLSTTCNISSPFFDDNGPAKAVSGLTTIDLLETICKENIGIPIFAHCQSAKGLFQKQNPSRRKEYFLNNINNKYNFILDHKTPDQIQQSINTLDGWSIEPDKFSYILTSDAHKANDVGSVYTWIKADPTFEGLKQIIYEPNDRVRIQESNPELEKRHAFLDTLKIVVSDNPHIPEQEIFFNRYMNSLIGGRATGKSALAKILNCANGPFNDNYIKKIKNDSKLNIELHYWDRSGELKTINIDLKNLQPNGLPIYYLSQEDIEKFSDEKENEKFRQEFLKELGISDNQQYYHDEFEKVDGSIENLRQIDERDNKLKSKLDQLSERHKQVINSNEIEKSIKSIIDNLVEEKKKYTSKETEATINEISKLNTLIDKLTNIKNSDLSAKIRHSVTTLNNIIREYNTKINNTEFENELYKSKKKSIPEYDSENFESIITENIQSLEAYISSLEMEKKPLIKNLSENGIDYKDIKSNIEYLDKTILSLQNDVKKYNEDSKKRSDIFNTLIKLLKNYRGKVEEAKDEINISFKEFKKDRSDLFNFIFKDVNISAGVYFKKKEFVNELRNHVYANSINSFNEIVPKDLNQDNYFKKFDKKFLEELFKNRNWIQESRGGYYKILEFIFKNFIKNYYSVAPKIELRGQELGEMSGGQQATLMLKLRLATKGIDNDIIILDQPENHLDNKFINRYLTDLFKELKKHKQLIIISHNANIVIGSDSEEVIIARMDEDDKTYLSGAIENILINKQILTTLEGSADAFRKREQRYKLN